MQQTTHFVTHLAMLEFLGTSAMHMAMTASASALAALQAVSHSTFRYLALKINQKNCRKPESVLIKLRAAYRGLDRVHTLSVTC